MIGIQMLQVTLYSAIQTLSAQCCLIKSGACRVCHGALPAACGGLSNPDHQVADGLPSFGCHDIIAGQLEPDVQDRCGCRLQTNPVWVGQAGLGPMWLNV